MSDKKYSPRVAALAVLAKAAEIAKKHAHVAKTDEADMDTVDSSPTDGQMAKGEFEAKAADEIKKPIPGDAEAPKADPKDQYKDKQGYELAKEEPSMKGHIKLAKFIGRMEQKRGSKKAE